MPPANRATLERLAEHIGQVAKLVGLDFVGTDYESGDAPSCIEHAGRLPNLTVALPRRGCSEQDIRKSLSDDFKSRYSRVLDPNSGNGAADYAD